MYQTEILYKSINPNIIAPIQKIDNCCFCGLERKEFYNAKDYLKSGFTNWDNLKKVNSNVICKYCAFSLDSNNGFRKTSFIASNKYLAFKNEDLQKYLFNPPVQNNIPWIFCVTKTFKKHNCFRARVNYSIEKYFIRWEELQIYFDTQKYKLVWDAIQLLYNNEFSKAEIESGNYYSNRIQKFGIEKWMELEEIIKPLRNSSALAVMLFALRRQEEKEVKIIKEKEEEILLPEGQLALF